MYFPLLGGTQFNPGIDKGQSRDPGEDDIDF